MCNKEVHLLVIMSSTCFDHPCVHPQEDLYTQFFGTSFMHPNKQSGRWQDVLDINILSEFDKLISLYIKLLQARIVNI
jgi:hypothetical protein